MRSASGGMIERQDIEPIKKIAPELLAADHLRNVLVGGGDHAHIHGDDQIASHADHFFFLEDPEKPDLKVEGHLTDLIQEKGAFVGQLKKALLSVLVGACKGALFISEQLALQQALHQRTAVDGDKGLVLSRGGVVNGLGKQLLANAGGACNQNVGVGAGHALGNGLALRQLFAAADDILKGVLRSGFAPRHLTAQLPLPLLLSPVIRDLQVACFTTGLQHKVELDGVCLPVIGHQLLLGLVPAVDLAGAQKGEGVKQRLADERLGGPLNKRGHVGIAVENMQIAGEGQKAALWGLIPNDGVEFTDGQVVDRWAELRAYLLKIIDKALGGGDVLDTKAKGDLKHGGHAEHAPSDAKILRISMRKIHVSKKHNVSGKGPLLQARIPYPHPFGGNSQPLEQGVAGQRGPGRLVGHYDGAGTLQLLDGPQLEFFQGIDALDDGTFRIEIFLRVRDQIQRGNQSHVGFDPAAMPLGNRDHFDRDMLEEALQSGLMVVGRNGDVADDGDAFHGIPPTGLGEKLAPGLLFILYSKRCVATPLYRHCTAPSSPAGQGGMLPPPRKKEDKTLKITEIKTFVANAYRTNFVFVKLYTDEGITGVGEGTLEYKEHALLGAVEDLKGYLLGKDPRRIEEHVFHMYRDSYWRTGPVLMSAISAVEMAMWDITGKYYGAPVHALLGGPVREEIELYANGWFAGARKPEEFAAKARAAVEKGVRALKWDPFGSAYLTLERREFAESIDCVAAVRDAVGGDVELLIEGHGRLNVETATRMARALAPYGPMFFEEPVPPDNLDALAEVHRRSPVPIAAGERIYSLAACREFLQKGCADFFQPDPSHCGGILAVKKMAAMAEPYYVSVAPHNPSGPVANAACLQLAGATINYAILEIMLTDVSWRRELTDEMVEFRAGKIHVPNRPGLGVELREEACRSHPFQPVYLRHYNGVLTDIRPEGKHTAYYFQNFD